MRVIVALALYCWFHKAAGLAFQASRDNNAKQRAGGLQLRSSRGNEGHLRGRTFILPQSVLQAVQGGQRESVAAGRAALAATLRTQDPARGPTVGAVASAASCAGVDAKAREAAGGRSTARGESATEGGATGVSTFPTELAWDDLSGRGPGDSQVVTAAAEAGTDKGRADDTDVEQWIAANFPSGSAVMHQKGSVL